MGALLDPHRGISDGGVSQMVQKQKHFPPGEARSRVVSTKRTILSPFTKEYRVLATNSGIRLFLEAFTLTKTEISMFGKMTPPLSCRRFCISVFGLTKWLRGVEFFRPISTASGHQWPEWKELMAELAQIGHIKPGGFPGNNASLAPKDANQIRTACLNFARDRVDVFRHLSRKDIQIVVDSGCPSTDRKVVNSGKRLRAHIGIEEANVCSSCKLRGSCERAYMAAQEDEGGRTVDVMRILLTYGLETMVPSIENQLYLSDTVRESLRRLLQGILTSGAKNMVSDPDNLESVRTSLESQSSSGKQLPKSQANAVTRQGDWICPKCDFLNFKKNIRCLRCDEMCQEKLKKLREEREHLPLKRGDWICNMCNFLNFSKNTRCLQCNEKPFKRFLGPGEWECPSCSFVNFRRNTVCLRCNWKRPKAASTNTSFPDFAPNGCQDNRACSSNNAVNQSISLKTRPQNEELGFWSSDEDEMDNNSPRLLDFEDFPVAGGKTAISRDPHEKQRWKEKRKDNNKWDDKKWTNSDSLNFHHSAQDDCLVPTNFRNSGSDEISDDDEISGWFAFRDKKIKT